MGTVTKALSLLRFFDQSRDLIGLSDMSRLSGFNKATTHRFLTELQTQGFVEQSGPTREYRLGPAVLRLAALREKAVPTRDLAEQVLSDLAKATNETAHFSLLQNEQLCAIAYRYPQHQGTRVTMGDADILSLHGTGSGLAVLAYSPADFVDRVLASPLEPHTDNTITNTNELREHLDRIRETGIAEGIGGFEDDVHSHAMPVFDSAAQVIGAIAVAAPSSRMTPDHQTTIKHALRQHALRLTDLLGGLLPSGINALEHI